MSAADIRARLTAELDHIHATQAALVAAEASIRDRLKEMEP